MDWSVKLEQADLDFHEGEFQRLTAELERSSAESHLPETARSTAAMNDLLVQIRLSSKS
jgi:uncharacterized protein